MTDTRSRNQAGVSQFLDGIAPWLIELGNWIFGGLIGFNAVILGAVVTILPVDSAVKIATAASALAIPPSAIGLVVLRLVADVRSIRESQRVESPETHRQEVARRRNAIVRRYAYVVMAVSIILTLVGLAATLWHIGWWIGVGFLVTLVLSVAVMFLAIAQLGGVERRLPPSDATEPSKNTKAP